jgi:hypothetical protein
MSVGASNAMVAWLASSCSGELEPRVPSSGARMSLVYFLVPALALYWLAGVVTGVMGLDP